MSRLAFALLATCALTGVAHAADPAPASIPVHVTGTTDADAVARTLDGLRFDGISAHGGEWRASDHMAVHDLYVLPVLPPAQPTEPHGGYRVLATVPAALAFPAGTQCRMAP